MDIGQIAPTKWTYQLISLSDEKSMLEYIKRNNLTNKGQYFSRTVNGQKRYTLIYGIYDSKKQAQKSSKNLPLIIQQGKLWIRSYADLHKLMKI